MRLAQQLRSMLALAKLKMYLPILVSALPSEAEIWMPAAVFFEIRRKASSPMLVTEEIITL